MLSFLKKKKNPEEAAAAAPQVPAWHPNFRNFEQLPDIKVVRTAFFVNGIAAFIALGLLVYLANHEYELHSLKTQIATYEEQIARDTKENGEMIARYVKFQEQEKRLTDVDAFMKSKPIVSEILLRIGETRPKNIALDSIDIRAPETNPSAGPSIVLRATVRGASELASSEASSYKDILLTDPVFGPKIESLDVSNPVRDSSTNRLKIEFTIKFKSAQPKAAAKKS